MIDARLPAPDLAFFRTIAESGVRDGTPYVRLQTGEILFGFSDWTKTYYAPHFEALTSEFEHYGLSGCVQQFLNQHKRSVRNFVRQTRTLSQTSKKSHAPKNAHSERRRRFVRLWRGRRRSGSDTDFNANCPASDRISRACDV